MGSRHNLIPTLVTLAICAFLFFVGRIWVESFTGRGGGGGGGGRDERASNMPNAVDGMKAVAQRSLTVHLPLAGSVPGELAPGNACERLEGFLLDAAFHLKQEDAVPPMSTDEIHALVTKKDCAVQDPEVANALVRFRTVWLQAGLAPVGPLGR